MASLSRALWERFGARADGDLGLSWVGFYLGPGGVNHEGTRAGDGEMILGPREPKPACSPIALHGACGRALLERRTLVVHDVAALGDGYVACDPRDRSELVVPLFDERGEAYGVFDADSFDVGAFTLEDARGAERLLARAGLTSVRDDAPPALVVGAPASA